MGATGERIKGKAMKAEGKLTGDRVRRGQGAIKEARGEAKAIVARATRKVKAAVRNAKARMSRAGNKARKPRRVTRQA